jgi:protocatechuate 3,4-dioxygenase beta subunit
VGGRSEIMTISRRDVIGLGSLLLASCAMPTVAIADDDDLPPRRCGPATADNIEGPFYKPGAPHRAVLATKRDAGAPLVIDGTVQTTDCKPIAGAVLDIWHADARGTYDLEGYRFRGALVTDSRGRWQLRTIVPGRYLNGRTYRPAHIHVKVRARGRAPLTTQLYFSEDPYNAKDPFIVESLIMEQRGSRARFDFVLA